MSAVANARDFAVDVTMQSMVKRCEELEAEVANAMCYNGGTQKCSRAAQTAGSVTPEDDSDACQ